MKLITACLLRCASIEHGFALGDEVASILAPRLKEYSKVLQDIKVKHLLEHTHGLDGSLASSLPLLQSGFIDACDLWRLLANSHPLAPPGAISSYSNCGAWIIGVLLEHLYNKEFHAFMDACVGRRSLQSVRQIRGPCCPATGSLYFRVKLSELLQFLAEELADVFCNLSSDHAELSSKVTPLPGWHPFERGIYLGWKYYGAGWFGHNSTVPTAPMLLRVNPFRKLVIVIATNGYNPNAIFAKVLAQEFGDFTRSDMPRPINPTELANMNLSGYQGVFGNSQIRLHITLDESGRLKLSVFRKRADSAGFVPDFTAFLRPAENDILFIQEQGIDFVPSIQFRHDDSRSCSYLWNGQSVWPAIPDSIPRQLEPKT